MAGELSSPRSNIVDHILSHIEKGEHYSIGVLIYDYEVSQFRNINLEDVVTEFMRCLARSEVQLAVDGSSYEDPFDLTDHKEYRTYVVKNLRAIDELNLAQVHWDIVYSIYPEAEDIVFDPEHDRKDGSFYDRFFRLPRIPYVQDEFAIWELLPEGQKNVY